MKKTLIITTTFILFLFNSALAQSQTPTILQSRICNGLATYLPKPEQPNLSDVNVSGVVNVQVSIDEQGGVTLAKAVSGHPLLRPLAEKAALKAKFKQTTFSGNPVKVSCVVVYNFVQDESISLKQVEEKPQVNSKLPAISLGVLNDRAIYLPQPKYPKEVLQPRSQGGVNVQVKINLQKGNIVSATAVSGNSLFKKYAEEAAMLAKFKPLTMEGSSLFATGLIIYEHPLGLTSNKKIRTTTGLPVIVVGVVNKRAVYLPKPIYPKSCRCLGIIKVQIVVDVSGNVISATADTGNPLLRVSAVQAALKTKFSPTFINGPPIFVVAFLQYRFYANGKVST